MVTLYSHYQRVIPPFIENKIKNWLRVRYKILGLYVASSIEPNMNVKADKSDMLI